MAGSARCCVVLEGHETDRWRQRQLWALGLPSVVAMSEGAPWEPRQRGEHGKAELGPG